MRFKDAQLAVPEIAKQLGVDAVVEGSVIREHESHTGPRAVDSCGYRRAFVVRILRSRTEDVLLLRAMWLIRSCERLTYRFGTGTLQGCGGAPCLSRGLRKLLAREVCSQQGHPTDIEQSIHYFEEAIHTDPKFAPAYVGLADAYDSLGLVFVGAPPGETRAKVIMQAQRALELDPQLAYAHVLLADAYRKQWKWTEAAAEYKRALELSPNSAAAYDGFADWLLCQGRVTEAVDWAERARELDPLVPGNNLAWILFQARRYDDAARELHATLAITPDDPVALWFLGFVLVAQGKSGDAIPVLEKADSLTHGSPGVRGVLVRAYATAGRRKDALGVLDELRRQHQTEYVPAAALVQAYIGIGDKEQALAYLEQAYKEQSNLLQWITTEPTFDPLRSDPRFTDLIHRVGLN